MKTEETLNKIFEVSMINPEIQKAKAYGIKLNDKNSLEATLLKDDVDVYDLIKGLSLDRIYSNYLYLSLVTTGWAAPISKDEEFQGKPSEHEDRRRVTLVSALDVNAKKIYGSVIEFEDSDERVFDFNEATGYLAIAINSLI